MVTPELLKCTIPSKMTLNFRREGLFIYKHKEVNLHLDLMCYIAKLNFIQISSNSSTNDIGRALKTLMDAVVHAIETRCKAKSWSPTAKR